MNVKYHWGVWVDSDEPTTGVYNANEVAWEWVNDEICLDCERAIAECEDDEELDYIECDSSHTRLFGDWILDTKTHQYEPDPNGEFAAIENESTIQVVFSKTLERGALCSPCYPGQVDMGSEGEFLAYSLPDYLLGK